MKKVTTEIKCMKLKLPPWFLKISQKRLPKGCDTKNRIPSHHTKTIHEPTNHIAGTDLTKLVLLRTNRLTNMSDINVDIDVHVLGYYEVANHRKNLNSNLFLT